MLNKNNGKCNSETEHLNTLQIHKTKTYDFEIINKEKQERIFESNFVTLTSN